MLETLAQSINRFADPSGLDMAATIGAQATFDTAAQASDELDEYNKRMREQGNR